RVWWGRPPGPRPAPWPAIVHFFEQRSRTPTGGQCRPGPPSARMNHHPELARLYRVRGRVQGVGFRYFVYRAALELDLTGYVKNLDDGRVEVYAVGPENKLSELVRRLWKGPSHADVRGVEEEEAPLERNSSFRVEAGW